MVKAAFLSLIVIFSSIQFAQAAALASVSASTITTGDSVELTIRTDTTGARPDFSLLEVNFEILSQRQMSQSSFSSQTGRTLITEWVLELMPKNKGTLRIPPLSIGKDKTEAIDIQVLGLTDAQKKMLNDRFILSTRAEKNSVYVQEGFLVTLEFAYLGNVDGGVVEPEVTNSMIEPWGGTRNSQKEIDGRLYTVLEQDYYVTPLASGNLTIPGFSVKGEYIRTSWSKKSRFTVSSDQIDILVKDIPANWPKGQPWLPALNVTAQNNWSKQPGKLQAGESVTRTLITKITGQFEKMVPGFSLPDMKGMRVYASTPETEESRTKLGPETIATYSWTMVPTLSGKVVIPDTTLFWWNLRSDSLEKLVIEGGEFESEIIQQQVIQPIVEPPLETLPETANDFKNPQESSASALIWQLLTLLFAIAWIITVVLYIKLRHKAGTLNNTEKGHALPINKQNKSNAFLAFKNACHENNGPEIYGLLVDTFNSYHRPSRPVQSVVELKNSVNASSFNLLISQLEMSLFKDGNVEINGEQILEAFKRLEVLERNKSNNSFSQVLYPS